MIDLIITRWQLLILLAGIGSALLLGGCSQLRPVASLMAVTETQSPTLTPTAIFPAPTTISTQTAIPSTKVATNTPFPTPTATSTPVLLPTATPTSVSTDTPFPTPTATSTPVLLPIITPTPISTFTPLPTSTATSMPVLLPIITPTPISTFTPLPTSTSIPPTPTPLPCLTPIALAPEKQPPLVGLHASADPQISHAERCTFMQMRPSIIKVLTFHPPEDIQRLAISQPSAQWIIRSFLSFGGRSVSPAQFVDWTLSDTQRTIDVLAGRDLVVELHNEPNLVAEGMTTAWQNGTHFSDWFLDVLAVYRSKMPTVRFLYPGLSPGETIDGVRQDSNSFWEESRAAVEAADGIGLHLYWSEDYPMSAALSVLDDVIARFPQKLIWITEASYNRGGIDDNDRAAQYLDFINHIQSRPAVQGVTFFVASASNPQFADETWVGRDIGRLIGERTP